MCSNIRREEYKEISMAEPLLSLGARRAASTGVLLSLSNRRSHEAITARQRQSRSVAPAAAPAAAARGLRGRAGGPRCEQGSGGAAPAYSPAPLPPAAPQPAAARPGHGAESPSGGPGPEGQECQDPSFQGRPPLEPSHRHSCEGVGEIQKPRRCKNAFS